VRAWFDRVRTQDFVILSEVLHPILVRQHIPAPVLMLCQLPSPYLHLTLFVSGPATQDERMMLISFYLPYFLVPVLLVLTMLMSGAYNDGEHTKTIMQHNKGTPKRKHHLKAH